MPGLAQHFPDSYGHARSKFQAAAAMRTAALSPSFTMSAISTM